LISVGALTDVTHERANVDEVAHVGSSSCRLADDLATVGVADHDCVAVEAVERALHRGAIGCEVSEFGDGPTGAGKVDSDHVVAECA
jgi:hypothetical protein